MGSIKDLTAIKEKKRHSLPETGIVNQLSFPVISEKVCNMDYLNSITRGDVKSRGIIVDAFFSEIRKELSTLDMAIEKTNYAIINNESHKIKSAFAILGVKVLEPVIKEMEQLSSISSSIEKIKQLKQRINIVFHMARAELKSIK